MAPLLIAVPHRYKNLCHKERVNIETRALASLVLEWGELEFMRCVATAIGSIDLERATPGPSKRA